MFIHGLTKCIGFKIVATLNKLLYQKVSVLCYTMFQNVYTVSNSYTVSENVATLLPSRVRHVYKGLPVLHNVSEV